MTHTVVIDSIEGVLQIIAEQDRLASIDRYRNSYLYRGMPNAAWQLVTSLRQNCKDQQKKLEPVILQNFTKYAMIEHPELERSVWRQMILGRHYGLPTRLLDWSRSPLVGLHFATAESSPKKIDMRDGVVWRIDMEELHHILPDPYQVPLRRNGSFTMSVDMLSEVTTDLEQYDRDMADSAMVIVEPPSMDPRIINQYSYFSIVPDGMADIEGFLDRHTSNTVRYVIKKEIRWRVRDMLDQLNISERVVYPGLDGLSKWLTRRYYVK